MKKNFISIQIIFTFFLLYADNKFKNFFYFDSYSYTEYIIDEHAWLEHDKLQNTGFSDCKVITIEKLKEIPYILYYPIGSNNIDLLKGMFEINNQKFIINDIRFDSSGIKVLTVSFEYKKYLLFIGYVGKYGDRVCFIFNITDPNHIIFYSPKDKFIEAEFGKDFFGIYQNKLCFFFSTANIDLNGQYRLIPYYIDDDSLKPLCDERSKYYFVNYVYKDRFKQKLVFGEKYTPNTNF